MRHRWKRIGVWVMAAVLAGCGLLPPERRAPATDESSADPSPYREAFDFGEMLKYGGYLGILTAEERHVECQQLLVRADNIPSRGQRLHLAFAMSMSEDCGDLERARSILLQEVEQTRDERLHQLLIMQVGMIERLMTELGRRDGFQQQLSRSMEREQRLKTELKASNTEREALRFKLDELKSIERTLNRREEGRVQ